MPEPVPDTVLLVSVGLSPQVVTETLHALREAGKALPSRLILLTTRRGAEAVRDHLTDPVSGQIAAWGRAWDVAGADALAGRAEIVEIDSDSGDMDAARSLALFAAGAARLVRDLTSQPDVALHVSIAGGRKPAAAILGILMALHGRAQDRLSHVLVEPEGVVGSDFFFPSPQPRKLFGRDGRAIDASAVRIRLLELPFPRLGPNLRDGFDAPTAFEEAIRGADSAPRLVIDRSSSSLTWDGEGHVWPPMPLAFLSMVAEARIAGQGGISRTETPREAFLRHYREMPRARDLALTDPLEGEWVEEKVSRVNALARDCAIRPGGGKLVDRFGPRSHAVYRIALAPGEIRIH